MNFRTLMLGLMTVSTLMASGAQALPSRFLQRSHVKLPEELEVVEGNYDQVLDHNDAKSRTFAQRYFYSTSYSTSPDAPVFYIICGESECGGIDIQPTIDMAKKLNANLVALEHRFYGKSQPFPGDHPLASANLQYLTMGQAIDDLVSFQKWIAKEKGWTGKWISVGGSYPGALSAFYRALHPEMVVGALASSATVKAIDDFYQYDDHVGKAMPASCLAVVKKVIADVETKIQSPESKIAIKETFNATDVADDRDFLYVVGDMLGASVQYGNINNLCKSIEAADAKGTATETYAKVAGDFYLRLGYKKVSDGAFGSYLDDSMNNAQVASLRGWMYESCNEFGFYQTVSHNAEYAARSSQITLQYHNEACARMFGMKKPVNVKRTNRRFFAAVLNKHTTNILMTNGSVDPFSEASLTPTNYTNNRRNHLDLFVLDGASHCNDLWTPDPRMATVLFNSISAAQAKLSDLVAKWLNE